MGGRGHPPRRLDNSYPSVPTTYDPNRCPAADRLGQQPPPESTVVALSDAAVHQNAVVVKRCNALIANSAMVRSKGRGKSASLAELATGGRVEGTRELSSTVPRLSTALVRLLLFIRGRGRGTGGLDIVTVVGAISTVVLATVPSEKG